VLEALEMAPKKAAICADLMVRTDLRGVDSHGIGMLPKYVEWTRADFMHPEAEPTVARDDQATALVDGQKGLGHPASVLAMELARARTIPFRPARPPTRGRSSPRACSPRAAAAASWAATRATAWA